MKGFKTIFFNDTVIATTDKPISFTRETDAQKEYRITDIKRDLSASFFSESRINFISNDNFLIEII